MATHRKKILHLEDDPEWAEIVRNALKGYIVYSVHNLKDAAKTADKKKFDLAVLDISLIPDDSQDDKGELFLKALEGIPILPGKRIIILSAYLLGSNQERTRKYFKYYNVLDAIPKQKFDSKEFKEIVDSAFSPKVGDS
jgi:CheY-like chemotaxis protein